MALVDESPGHKDNRGSPLPSSLQVLIALRFFVTGTFQDVIGEMVGVSQMTVSRAVKRVTNALFRHVNAHVVFPTQQRANTQKHKFASIAGMPSVFACIDGTHIRILRPSVEEQAYINRKNDHSNNVQVVCDADYHIINYVTTMPGSAHDARILRESQLFGLFEAPQTPGDGFMLGDSGYMIRDWRLTPFAVCQNREQHKDSTMFTRQLAALLNDV